MKSRLGLVGGTVAVSTVVLLVALCTWAETTTNSLTVSGADALAATVDDAGKEFSVKFKDVTIMVHGTTTGDGIQKLITGDSQIAMASRKISPAEKERATQNKIDLGEKIVGHIDLLIVMNAGNPIEELSLGQLKGIFTGKHTNWKEVGGPNLPITVVEVDMPGSGVAEFFKSDVLGGEPMVKGHLVAERFRTALRFVGAVDNPGAITYCRVADEDTLRRRRAFGSVKVIAVKEKAGSPAIKPTHIVSPDKQHYPIAQPYYMYYDKKLETAGKFVESCAEYIRQQDKSD